MSNLLPRLQFLGQALYRRQRSCPHCGAAEVRRRARKYGVVRVLQCQRCSLFFTSPIYRNARLYDGAYSAEGSTTDLPGEVELDLRKRTLFAGTDKDSLERLRLLRGLGGGRRLLEIGSSWGYFLFQAQRMGFKAAGVEPGRRRREFGISRLGVDLVSRLEELAERRFDLIYTAHALEHFTDLSDVFARIAQLLEAGGHLVIEVPHFDWPGRGRRALPAIGAVHPLGFTPGFFAENLPRHGLEVLGLYSSWSEFPGSRLEQAGDDVVLCLARKLPPEAGS